MFDFSTWQGVLTSLIGILVVTLLGVGIRLALMMTIQQRRARENRQINERMRALIAAYKVLGGSFTGDLTVDPTHLRDLRRRAQEASSADGGPEPAGPTLDLEDNGSDRARRIRDAVEAALSDIILLGTEDQVRLAAQAAGELAAGQPVHTAGLVVSLRDFIREALDIERIPGDVVLPPQGPARPQSGGGGRGGGGRDGGGRGGGQGGGGGGQGGGGGMGMGMGMGAGMGAGIGMGGADAAPDAATGNPAT